MRNGVSCSFYCVLYSRICSSIWAFQYTLCTNAFRREYYLIFHSYDMFKHKSCDKVLSINIIFTPQIIYTAKEIHFLIWWVHNILYKNIYKINRSHSIRSLAHYTQCNIHMYKGVFDF